MDVIEALSQRKSVRAFLDKEVEQEKLYRILTAASRAPSGGNIQPWQVAVVSGKTKRKLQSKIENAFLNNHPSNPDYRYYPDDWLEPYQARRKACGLQLYSALGIERRDIQRKRDQWAANYRSFDAPVMLLFFMDKVMQTGSYLDYGMFLQSIMLAAIELGLATCPQAALAEYPDLIKEELGYPGDRILICGMAIGYENKTALVNSYRTPRESIDSFTRFFE